MNQYKAAIYKAITNTQVARKPDQPDAIELQARKLLDTPVSIQPPLPFSDPVESFRHRINSEKIAGSIESIESIEKLPAAIRRYLSDHQLSTTIALQATETLLNLDWNGFTLKHQADSDEQLAITLGHWGIAETGSVVISSAADSPVLLNFLPSHHILVLFEKNILVNLEDYVMKISSLNESRMVCLVTGASGTTDIEGVLVNGAHGPEHLHIITVKQCS